MDDILQELGVEADTLTADERWSLDRLGYVTFPDAIPPDTLAQLREGFDAASGFAMTEEKALKEEAGADRRTNLEHFSAVFDAAWRHPKHLAAVWHVLDRPFELFTINGRDPRTGQGQQPLHRDNPPGKQPVPQAVQSVWMLDDFTADNGATRIVPASHFLDDRYFELDRDTAHGHHPGQVLLTGKAGTITVFSTHLLHGGTQNTAGQPRRTLHSTFVPRDGRRRCPHEQWISDTMRARLSQAQLALLGID